MKSRTRQWISEMNTRRVKTNLSFIVVAAILLELISGIQFLYSRHLLEIELENRAEWELRKKADILDNSRTMFESYLSNHIWDMEQYLATPDSMYEVAEWILMSNPHVVCAGIAFTPYYYPEKGRLFEPYAFRKDGKIVFEQLGVEEHDYTKGEIYNYVTENNKDYWSRPYYDSLLTHSNLITYCLPIYGQKFRKHRSGEGEMGVIAMLGLDIETTFFNDTLNTDNMYESSFVVLFNKEDDIITYPDMKYASLECVKEVLHVMRDEKEHKPSQSGKCTVADFHDPDDGSKGYVFFCDLRNNWQMGVVCYDDEVFGPLYHMRLLVFLMMLLALLILTFLILRFVHNDIRVEQTQAAKQRMDNELLLARSIQMQMLPAGPGNNGLTNNGQLGVEIYGKLIPAREVGGDLYDYFVRDENIFFCIGDVSGKGIPAAMFMSATVNLFRSAVRRLSSTKAIMEEMNAILSANNPGLTFVTAFIGKIHIPTGTMSFCNAGHVPPMLLKGQTAQGPSTVESLDVVPNIPLGYEGSFRFVEQGIQLSQNDMLVLCTDGITEARNPENQMLGILHWKEIIAQGGDLIESVHRFMLDAEQADDITLLTVRLLANPQPFVCTLPNRMDSWERVKSALAEMSLCAGFEQRMRRKMVLAVEEIFMNIVHYSGATEIGVSISRTDGARGLTVTLCDDGIPFDPTAQEEVDVTKTTSDRQVGGLGIALVRQIMDDIRYRRENDRNIFTMTKKIQPYDTRTN